MLSVVTCDQYNGWSDTGYCNKEYDKMYSQQGTTLDQAKRREVVWKMQEIAAIDKRPTSCSLRGWITRRTSKSWTGLVPRRRAPFNSLSKQSLTKVHRRTMTCRKGNRMRGADYVVKRVAFALVTVFVASRSTSCCSGSPPGAR